ncbi:MAG TPA: branched-chain amino acid ABC transporter permease, partial [Ilumatobacteraceae bacterium]|nr:branched-chain amino acid ABC transporter permease [Ilumatobacteraceae bacterium]
MGLLGERRGLLVGVLLAVALVVVLIATGEDASLVIGVTTGSAYGMVALGLVLVYKSSGVFNFVQGEFGTVALYALYLLDFHTGYWLALLGALVAAGLMGFLTERVIVRPLFNAPRVTLLVATAGVALLSIAVEIWFAGAQGKPIAKAFERVDRVEVLGVQVSDQRIWLIVTLAVLAVLLGLFFTRTNLGLAIIGASQEPTATELAGISVRRLSTFTWVLAALLGGLAALIAVPDGGSFG